MATAKKTKKPVAKLAPKKVANTSAAAASPEAGEQEMVISIKLLHPIKHDGKRIPAETVIELSEEAATNLVDSGYAEWADADEPQEPASETQVNS